MLPYLIVVEEYKV